MRGPVSRREQAEGGTCSGGTQAPMGGEEVKNGMRMSKPTAGADNQSVQRALESS